MGIYEAGNYLVQEDLDLWFNTFAPHIPKGTHPTLDLVDSGNATDGKHVESILDLSIAYSIIYPQNTILYQVNDLWYNEQLANSTGQSSFNTFLDGMYISSWTIIAAKILTLSAQRLTAHTVHTLHTTKQGMTLRSIQYIPTLMATLLRVTMVN